MLKIVVLAFMLSITPVIAQPQQPVQPVEYNIKLTGQDVELIGEGLLELPAKKVFGLLQKIRQQVIEQQMPKEPPKVEPPKMIEPK